MRRSDGRSSRRLPRAAIAGLVVLVLAAAALAAWFLIVPSPERRAGALDGFAVEEVQRRDLAVGISVAGRLGYGAHEPLPVRLTGTVTWLPPTGDRVGLGETLLKVDNRPVVLMYGATPAYRTLGLADEPRKTGGRPAPVPLEGPDVRQLEQGLADLGYAGFTVDEELTAGTTTAIRAWQRDRGVDVTGQVELGEVVFQPGPVRVHPDAAALGRPASETAVQVSGTTTFVAVDSEDTDWAERGTPVRVTLPDQQVRRGRVIAVSSGSGDQESGASGTRTVRIVVPDLPPGVGVGPVTVRYVATERRDVLAVPVTALVALAEGGYGVERDDGGLVAVRPGLFADGFVEVTGDLDAGTRIRVPS